MSALSEFRRKTLKISQEAMSAQLGYEKWQTYAAQESGRNPLPEEVKVKLEKKFKFKGPWPDQEAQDAAAPAGGPYLTEAAFADWRGYWRRGEEEVLRRVEALQKQVAVLEDQVRKLRQQAESA